MRVRTSTGAQRPRELWTSGARTEPVPQGPVL
jgi:hypothetical protein